MRMWLVNVEYMCDAHLRREHNDLHGIDRRVKHGKSTKDIICEPGVIYERHIEVVTEMLKRGFSHNTPLHKFEYKHSNQIIWRNEALAELLASCSKCRRRVLNVV